MPDATSTPPTTVPAYPFGPDEALTIDPRYLALLEREPVSRVRLPYGGDAWLVLGHEANRVALRDPRFSRAATLGVDLPRVFAEPDDQPSVLSMDPPDHTRLRRLVAKAFTGRRIAELRPVVAGFVHEAVTGVERAGRGADLMALLARRIPVRVICLLLGVPRSDEAEFGAWSATAMDLNTQDKAGKDAAVGNLWGYISRQVAQRRAAPADDVLGHLVAARDGTDGLTEAELVFLGLTLLVVGHETAEKAIGNLVHLLLDHPAERAALRRDPALLPTAVEELLRLMPLQTAAGVFPRVATAEVDLDGVRIAAGDTVFPYSAVANRDPRVFPEPHRLRFDRGANHHLTFGHGIHTCLGAQLARIELQEVARVLFGRLPGLEFAAPAAELRWETGGFVRGPETLPVSW
jgi:cytochrome P450